MHELRPLDHERYLVWDLLRETDPYYLNHHLFDVDFGAIEADRCRRRQDRRPVPSFVAYALAAYGRVLDRHRILNSYLRLWPRTRLAVYDRVDVALTIEREADGRRIVLLSLLTDAGHRSVDEIHAFLQHRRTAPLADLPEYDSYRRMLRIPAWCRWHLFQLVVKPFPGWMQQLVGTTAFTSIGRFGTTLTTPLSPRTVTMSLGRVEPRPRAHDGAVTIRPSAWVTLTYDHRVVDGAEIARAGDEVRDWLERAGDVPGAAVGLPPGPAIDGRSP